MLQPTCSRPCPCFPAQSQTLDQYNAEYCRRIYLVLVRGTVRLCSMSPHLCILQTVHDLRDPAHLHMHVIDNKCLYCWSTIYPQKNIKNNSKNNSSANLIYRLPRLKSSMNSTLGLLKSAQTCQNMSKSASLQVLLIYCQGKI